MGRKKQTLLYEVSPRDPVTLLSVSLLLVSVVLGASFVHAVGAVRIHPIVA